MKYFCLMLFAALIIFSAVRCNQPSADNNEIAHPVHVDSFMLVSVVERTPEIGLRKAMGARKRDIRRQFLVESILLAGTGGLIGVGLGAAAAKIISALSPLPSTLEAIPVILGLVLACSVGLISGLWPAVKAARLDPIVALRTE